MARNRKNVITYGASGKIGNIVLQSDGIIRSRPDVSKRVWSPLQRKHLTRVQEAKKYAARVKADPDLTAIYASQLGNWKKKLGANIGVYQLAIMDAMNPPKITGVKYVPEAGSRGIDIHISSEKKVTSGDCRVRIFDGSGLLLEEGMAACDPLCLDYRYCLQDQACAAERITVSISITDLPGHTVTGDFPLDISGR